MSRIQCSEEYNVSERVTLRSGDIFRAKGGPYYVKRDAKGNKVRMSMAARGPFRFMRLCEQGTRKWIEAVSMKDGTAAVLSLTKRRSVLPGALIPRPYVIVGKVGGAKAVRLEAKRQRRGAGGRRGRHGEAGGAVPPAAAEGLAAGAAGGPQKAGGGRRGAGAGGRGRRAVEAVLASLKTIDPSGR